MPTLNGFPIHPLYWQSGSEPVYNGVYSGVIILTINLSTYPKKDLHDLTRVPLKYLMLMNSTHLSQCS